MSSPRIHQFNKQAINDGKYVLYILRCVRRKCSPALAHSIRRANALKVPVLSAFFFNQEHHNQAQKVFLMEGLIEMKMLLDSIGVGMHCYNCDHGTSLQIAVEFCEFATEVVIDAGYLRHERIFEEELNNILINRCRRLSCIEGNIVVPVELASDRAEFNARTFRPKIWQHVKTMLKEKWNDEPQNRFTDFKVLNKMKSNELNLPAEFKELNSARGKTIWKGGENEAYRLLDEFISRRIENYETRRNIPGDSKQNYLLPYLHYGMISPMDIMLKVHKSSASKESKDAYFEEMLIRRELAHNFTYHRRDSYDQLDGLPDWVKMTMDKHSNDKRSHLYSNDQLECGLTHDIYFNAAQLEMVHASKMHVYMRMYWGKKVIEWTSSYTEAINFVFDQCNKYDLSGNDPETYAVNLWNFGLHDRAHAERAVLGKIRYMGAEGLQRKYKKEIENYVAVNYKLAGRLNKPTDEPSNKKKRSK